MTKKPLWTNFIIPFTVVLMLLAIHGIDLLFELNLNRFGVEPRDLKHAYGILTFFFLHGSWEHVINNAIALVVLLTLLRYYFPTLFFKVLIFSIWTPAFLTFLVARDGIHIGASGAVYSLAAFLFVSSIMRANRYMLSLSLLITFLYGSLWWGMLPVEPGISFEGHAVGALVGVVLAFVYSKKPTAEHLKEPEPILDDDTQPDVIGDAWKTVEPIEVKYFYVEKENTENNQSEVSKE